MANISDMIEEFLIDTLGDEGQLDISRNDLAAYFNVAPSQINYVLSTRFNYARGFLTESKRGGGGHITILRANDQTEWEKAVNDKLQNVVDFKTACYIIDEMVNNGKLSKAEGGMLKKVVSPSALNNPFKLEDRIRAQILRRILFENKGKGE